MPYGDGIERINCFSLTDFHDFDDCEFRFYVRHNLDRKYEIDEGSPQMALGSLLDQSIKKFHKSKAYGVSADYLSNIVRASANFMKEQVLEKGPRSFFGSSAPFLTEDLILRAADIFKNYYEKKKGKIRQSLGDVGFCEWIIREDRSFKLWGGPDTLEMGDDGVAEIVDYKSRENLDKNFDMELMPKIYTLLVAKKLLEMGHKKARFVIRIWQDPADEDIFEEFDLENLGDIAKLFREKIDIILENTEIQFCNRKYCRACNSEKRDEYLKELKKMGLTVKLDSELFRVFPK